MFDVNSAMQLLYNAGPYAILASVALNVMISIMGFVPSFFITAANIMVFGIISGFVISWAGEVIGASAAFMLYRGGVRSISSKVSYSQWRIIKSINNMTGAKQIYYMAVIRIAPFFPSGLINMFGALTSISMRTFFIATLIGKIPALLMESAFVYNVITINKNLFGLVLTSAVVMLLYFLLKKELGRLDE